MRVAVFSGQGSQKKRMGSRLFSEFPDLVEKANHILGYSITKLCVEDDQNKLENTFYTQPALFVVGALAYLKKLRETGKEPDFVAGHSLGEYNALFAARVFDFETGLKLVQKRGELMSQAKEGGMAAILGLKSAEVQAILHQHHLMTVNISNYNTYTQNVISGPKDDILKAQVFFEDLGIMFIPLAVSGAFHSPLMRPAQLAFAAFVNEFTFSSPQIPVIANYHAKPYLTHEVQSNLIEQITHPVLWTQSIEYLLKEGDVIFEDMGPRPVLTGMIQKIQDGQ